MARVDFHCSCGHAFFVSKAKVVDDSVECPACANPVTGGVTRTSAAPAKPGTRKVATPLTSAGDHGPASKRKLYILIGAGAAGVGLLAVILMVAFSGPKADPEKEAALAVQQRKKAFEDMAAKIKEPAAGPATPPNSAPAGPSKPGAPSPAVAAPLTGPTPSKAAPVKSAPSPPAVKGGTTPGVLNPDLIARVRTEIVTLPSWYEGLLLSEEEHTRLDGLLGAGKGLPGDAAFLNGLLSGAKLRSIREEMALISQTAPAAEREAQDSLPLDRVVLKDNRALNCRILEEGADVIRVTRTMSSGVSGQMPLRKDNILRVEKGKGIGAEFGPRWEAARKESPAEQLKVLAWCKENGLGSQVRWIAFSILKTDPSIAQARLEAGLAEDPVKAVEAGSLSYQGRSWNPKELKDKLIKDGYFLIDGQWYSRRERTIAVPGLFRYEKQNDKPVLIGGSAMLSHDTETTYKQVQEPGTAASVEQPEVRYLKRFYAPPMSVELAGRFPPGFTPPVSTFEQDVRVDYDQGVPPPNTPLKGEVPISVPLGEPVLEASVMTIAEVKAGGTITIYHVTGSVDTEKRTKLYQCDPKESQMHVIPSELLRGTTEVNLVAVIEGVSGYTQKIEKRHVHNMVKEGKRVLAPALDVIHYRMVPDYKAMLFPSSASGSSEVFRLKVATGEPVASLNKLFAATPEALK